VTALGHDHDRFEVIDDGRTVWRIERSFVTSNWTCIWGKGCLGILDRPAPELNQGCCSVGAHLDGDEEAATIGGLAATLDPERFQFHEVAATGGVYSDETRTYMAGRLAYHLDKSFNDHVKAFHNLEYIPSFERIDTYLVNADVGMRAAMTARLALEAKAQLAYNSQPSDGRDKKDLRYILGVGWTF